MSADNQRKPGRPKSKVDPDNGIARLLESGIQDLVFIPVPSHRRVKSAFWASINENPILDPASDGISLSMALQITGDTRLNKWWHLPGFVEWFVNKDEFRQRVEYLANLALDVAEEILLDRDSNPNARVNMTKLVIEVANKLPKNNKDDSKFLDARIASMSKEELEDFIRKQSKLLMPASANLPESEEK